MKKSLKMKICSRGHKHKGSGACPICWPGRTGKSKDVTGYIASAPKEVRSRLKQIRAIIKSVAPKALEKISYGMPYYGHKGRLAYFAYAKNHIGLYAMPPVISDHEKELRKYRTSTATIRFPLDGKLPVALIRKLIKEGVKNNELKSRK